jgi:prepilin-type N-terminal cleavage/methylation domain-containing protein
MVYQTKFKKQIHGFSLIEMIIVVGIFSLISLISSSIYTSFKSQGNINIAAYTIVEGLRHAQSNAEKAKGDSRWGVEILSDKIVVFKGDDYNSRDTGSDEFLNFPNGISASGLSEVVFEKITGITSNTGTTTLTKTNSTSTKDIYINEKGTITY